jgi:hypothetical protein
MNSRLSKVSLPISIGLGFFFAVYLVIFRPGYLLSVEYLGMLIFLQVLAAVLRRFPQRFLPFLIFMFLAATTTLPLESARWVILAAGALAGCAICSKDRQHSLGTFHWVALFCVLAALGSTTVRVYPGQAAFSTALPSPLPRMDSFNVIPSAR